MSQIYISKYIDKGVWVCVFRQILLVQDRCQIWMMRLICVMCVMTRVTHMAHIMSHHGDLAIALYGVVRMYMSEYHHTVYPPYYLCRVCQVSNV